MKGSDACNITCLSQDTDSIFNTAVLPWIEEMISVTENKGQGGGTVIEFRKCYAIY